MTRLEDFDRVGDLLGDACETAAERPVEKAGHDDGPRAARPDGPVATPAATVTPTRSVDTSRAVAQAWQQVAGDEVVANASPVRLSAGKLTVSTSSSIWAHTLQYMENDLVARLNEHMGSEVVERIVFRHAGWEESSRHGVSPACGSRLSAAAGPPAPGLTAEQEAALAEVEQLDLPAAVREKMTRAMRASFVRAQRDPVR